MIFGPGLLWGTTNYCRDQRQDWGEFILLLSKPHCVPDESRESSGMCCTSLVLPRAGEGDGNSLTWSLWHCHPCEGLGAVASRNKAERWPLCHLCEAACRPQAGFGDLLGAGICGCPLPSLAGTRWLLQTPVSREGSLKGPKALLAWSCQISTSGDSDHWVISGKVLHVWSRAVCPCRHGLTGLMSCAGLSELALPDSEMLS